jgi:hypothetical protein
VIVPSEVLQAPTNKLAPVDAAAEYDQTLLSLPAVSRPTFDPEVSMPHLAAEVETSKDEERDRTDAVRAPDREPTTDEDLRALSSQDDKTLLDPGAVMAALADEIQRRPAVVRGSAPPSKPTDPSSSAAARMDSAPTAPPHHAKPAPMVNLRGPAPGSTSSAGGRSISSHGGLSPLQRPVTSDPPGSMPLVMPVSKSSSASVPEYRPPSSSKKTVLIAAILVVIAAALAAVAGMLPALRGPKVVMMRIESVPTGGKVLINGQLQPTLTPLETSLPADQPVKIEIQTDGYENFVKELTPMAGVPVNLSAALQEMRPTLTITVAPDDSRVFINGMLRGPGPKLDVSDLPVGRPIKIHIERDGYKTFEELLTLSPTDRRPVKAFTLEKEVAPSLRHKPH